MRYAARTGALLAAVFATAAPAQDYPTRPLRVLVGFPPGGGVDAAARAAGQILEQAFGVPVVVDNRPGAGGNVGAEIATRANPDGHTLLTSSPGPVAVNQTLYARLAYDPEKQLTPVTLIGSSPNVLVVYPGLPAKNVQELIALARAKPGSLNYASSGIGSTPHLSGELFKMHAKVDMVHVAYKGAGAGVVDLMSGRVQVMLVSAPSVIKQVEAGRLRALAVTTRKRAAILPDLPTLDEAGLKGYEAAVWWGLFAPAGTPGAIVALVQSTVAKGLHTPAIEKRFARTGAEVGGNTPEEFAAFVRDEIRKWAEVVRVSGMKVR